MVHIPLFFKALALGFSIAAPVGPIGILCINLSLSYGMLMGLVAGLGAACADGIFALIAGLGLTALSHFFLLHATPIKTIGGLFLIYLGYSIACRTPSCDTEFTPPSRSYITTFVATFFLTLSNPLTILAFLGILSIFPLTQSTTQGTIMLVSGMALGSALWWLVLSSASSLLKAYILPSTLRGINRVSGAVLVIFGLLALLSVFIR